MEWYEIIGTVATSVAAISAALSANYSKRQTKMITEERHALIKPIFRARSFFEKTPDKLLEISVRNVGYPRYLNDIEVYWVGSKDVEVSILDIANLVDDDSMEFQVFLNYKNRDGFNDIIGDLRIVYRDILGKVYDEKINIKIKYKYNDIYEEYYPVLINTKNQYFK